MTSGKASIYTETIEWKGVPHLLELFPPDAETVATQVVQVQGVPITIDDQVVLYRHIDGYWGLPGGHVERGEAPEEALKREFLEEGGLAIKNLRLIFKLLDTDLVTGNQTLQLRYCARVEKATEVNDPDNKSMGIECFSIDEAPKLLNWGRRGEILIETAAATQF